MIVLTKERLVVCLLLIFVFFAQYAFGSNMELLASLPNFDKPVEEKRGKILAVVSSTSQYPTTGEKTGFELSELARGYYTFRVNGFEVDITSPKGGAAPPDIDEDDMQEIDYIFLKDEVAQRKVNNTLRPEDVNAEEYAAIYFVGGKGPMFDFPNHQPLKEITRIIYEKGGVVSAVCHGPAGLLNVRLSNGEYLVDGKHITSVSNDEELFLEPEAKEKFSFLLEDELKAQGAIFEKNKSIYLPIMVQDDRIITAGVWTNFPAAEAVVKRLGYTPIKRQPSNDELSLDVVKAFHKLGYDEAKKRLESIENPVFFTFVVYAYVSFVEGEISNAFKLLWLGL